MDAGTIALQSDDELSKDASNLITALAGQSWVAAALAGVVLIVALLKKFGVGQKKVEPAPEVKPSADNDKAADEARALLQMGKKEE